MTERQRDRENDRKLEGEGERAKTSIILPLNSNKPPWMSDLNSAKVGFAEKMRQLDRRGKTTGRKPLGLRRQLTSITRNLGRKDRTIKNKLI